MSLSDAPAPPPDVFANATFWVDGSVSERDTVVANIESHGGKVVNLIQEARYAVVRSVMSDELQRTVSSVGIPCVVSSWIPQSIEAKRMLPTNGHQPALAPQTVAVPPVSTLPKESSSVSGESTAVESPMHAGSRHLTTNGEPSTNSHESPMDPNLDANAGESEVDELDQSVAVDSPNRRRRGKAYSQDDITAMQNHFRQQMALNPKPSHSAIWETFAYAHPYRKASSWQQYFYNHKSLFLGNATSITPKEESMSTPPPASAVPTPAPAPVSAPTVAPAHPRPSEGYDPWDDEDESALVAFLSKTVKPSLDMEDWSRMAREAGRSRSGRSYMMKYHKNRPAYDLKSGRETPANSAYSAVSVSKQTAFVPLAQDGALKRSRPSDFESPESSSQRPVRARARRLSYAEDGTDETFENEDEIMQDGEHRPPPRSVAGAPRSPLSPGDPPFAYARQSFTPRQSVSNGPAPSPAPGGAPWMSLFTPDDKAAALTWAVSRPQPSDLLDNVRSWLEFAEAHPSHTAPEWLCHYFWHYQTFQSVESNLGANLL